MGKTSESGKAEQNAQPSTEQKKDSTPTIIVSDSKAVVVRKNVLTKPKLVSNDVFGNTIEER
jgi:hypothetical protein